MCEEKRHGIVYMPCSICVVDECSQRSNQRIGGCDYGKPSNELIKWAFEYTNFLKGIGVPKQAEINIEVSGE